MENDERAAFQQVDVPITLFSFWTSCFPDNPLMVLVETLGRSLQFVVPPKNVLSSFLGEGLCWAKVLDEAWCVDNLAQTRRVALDVRPNGRELIFTRAPATGREEAFAARFNCDGVLSRKQLLGRKVSHSF